jgi:hypothetical protein
VIHLCKPDGLGVLFYDGFFYFYRLVVPLLLLLLL